MIIVDMTVWVDYLRRTPSPHAAWLDSKLAVERFGLTDRILCEVLQGVETNARFAAVQAELLRFEIHETGTIELAVGAIANYRRLCDAGRTVRRTIDCLIATFCLVEGHTLLDNDRDYDPFEKRLGLKIVHP